MEQYLNSILKDHNINYEQKGECKSLNKFEIIYNILQTLWSNRFKLKKKFFNLGKNHPALIQVLTKYKQEKSLKLINCEISDVPDIYFEKNNKDGLMLKKISFISSLDTLTAQNQIKPQYINQKKMDYFKKLKKLKYNRKQSLINEMLSSLFKINKQETDRYFNQSSLNKPKTDIISEILYMLKQYRNVNIIKIPLFLNSSNKRSKPKINKILQIQNENQKVYKIQIMRNNQYIVLNKKIIFNKYLKSYDANVQERLILSIDTNDKSITITNFQGDDLWNFGVELHQQFFKCNFALNTNYIIYTYNNKSCCIVKVSDIDKYGKKQIHYLEGPFIGQPFYFNQFYVARISISKIHLFSFAKQTQQSIPISQIFDLLLNEDISDSIIIFDYPLNLQRISRMNFFSIQKNQVIQRITISTPMSFKPFLANKRWLICLKSMQARQTIRKYFLCQIYNVNTKKLLFTLKLDSIISNLHLTEDQKNIMIRLQGYGYHQDLYKYEICTRKLIYHVELSPNSISTEKSEVYFQKMGASEIRLFDFSQKQK